MGKIKDGFSLVKLSQRPAREAREPHAVTSFSETLKVLGLLLNRN